jgi:hypothetical protein
MGQNVLVLGAGFSHAAGIPLMSGFIEAMWEISMRQSLNGQQLSAEDIKTFAAAAEVWRQLDRYHGRANFDDRNIEDVLSILSFHALSGAGDAAQQIAAMNRAIARTIELTCSVKHDGIPEHGNWSITEIGPSIYRRFWHALFRWVARGNPWPTIVTLNYDLILERSLLQLLINRREPGDDLPLPGSYLKLNYHAPNVPSEIWRIAGCQYTSTSSTRADAGTTVQKPDVQAASSLTEIDLLKLHGSLNFPLGGIKEGENYNVARVQPIPHILPPISNKLTSQNSTEMWKQALTKLSRAQNVILVGYSLPITDIYMQYFLRAAIGPNLDINDIVVFDPAFGTASTYGDQMRERYTACFAPQLRKRITFTPAGTEAFVETLWKNPESLLF